MTYSATDHLVIQVEDMDAAIEQWKDKLGFTLSHRADIEAVGIRQAFFLLGDGSFMELIGPLNDNSVVNKSLEARGEGIHSVSLTVDDLEETVTNLQKKGVELVGVGTPQVSIHPRSANGVRIQLWDSKRPHRWKENPSEGAKQSGET